MCLSFWNGKDKCSFGCGAVALSHANPKVRQQTLEWLKTCVASESKDSLKQVQSQITPGAAKLTDDSLPAIREAALAVLLEFCLKVTDGYTLYVSVVRIVMVIAL